MRPPALEYYATPGRFTVLDDADLPPGGVVQDGIDGVVAAVQGLLVHDTVAGPFYGVDLTPLQADAIHERDSARLLELALEVDPRPVTVPRPPAARIGGRCHTFTKLAVAFLRHAGVPARARCGLSMIREHCAHWIAGNLRLDLAALNRVEMLPWDVWGAVWEPGEEPTDDLLALFDAVAELTVDPDAHLPALRERYGSDERLRMDGTVYSVARGRFETVG